jgi:hypothetical protein
MKVAKIASFIMIIFEGPIINMVFVKEAMAANY